MPPTASAKPIRIFKRPTTIRTRPRRLPCMTPPWKFECWSGKRAPACWFLPCWFLHWAFMRTAHCPEEIQPEEIQRGSKVVEPSMGDAIADDIGAGPEVQLFGSARLVGFDGLYAHIEARRDLLVAETLRRQSQHLVLALAEMLPAGRRRSVPFEFRKRLGGDFRVEIHAAERHGANGPNQVFGGGALQDVAFDAGLQQQLHIGAVLVDGQSQKLDRR